MRRFVVMGVSGCGKTSIGMAFAATIKGRFIDGDDLHPEANPQRMAAGTPLTDADREPWLRRVGAALRKVEAPTVIGCSALRRRYRDIIRAEAGGPVQFLHLAGTRDLLARRMAAREGHFMPASLLDSPGALIIDMSSIDPEATKALAARAAEKRLRWVDSPLSGGAPKALIGQLTLMAGGTAEDVADARTVLRHVASNYTHMGPVGAGQTTKLINQVLCGLNFMAVAEATQLALDAGVDAAKVPEALKGGRADSAILQEYMPRFAGRDYRRTGRIDNMVKDLNAAQDLARRTSTAMPMTALCAEIHRMLTAAGLGGEDHAALMEFFKGPDKEQFQ